MADIDLGFAEKCESQWLVNSHFPSKLGGKPAWLHLENLPTSDSLKCDKCNGQKSFLCQIYAPFDDEYNFHRMLYVFVCRTETCYEYNNNGNITVFRSQLPLHNEFFSDTPPPEEGDALPQVLPKDLKLCVVCGCIGPLKCGRCKMTNYCGAHHQRLHWKYHKKCCSTDVSTHYIGNEEPITDVLFPEWEIDMNSEDDDDQEECAANPEINEQEELHKLEKLTTSGKAGEFQNLPETELEKYTKGCEDVDDKQFRKFRKECNKYPKQIIRYKRNGLPLWISDTENTVNQQLTNVPKCEICGEKRVFEFQIMPQMLNYLNDPNIDWGVIAVYTCPKSCPLPANKGYVEEYCIKQDIIK